MTQQPPPPAEPGRRCRRRAAAGRPALALVLLAALLAALPGCARAQVLPLDKQALLEFKAGLTEEGGQLLASWVPQSDPCLDAWTGVRCSCADFFEAADSAKVRALLGAQACVGLVAACRCAGHMLPLLLLARAAGSCCWHPAALHVSTALPLRLPPLAAQVCSQPPELPDGSRVLQLNFGDPRITEWNSLTGTIAPILANLTALRVLNFNSNHLYGALPPDLARLQARALPGPWVHELGRLRWRWPWLAPAAAASCQLTRACAWRTSHHPGWRSRWSSCCWAATG